MTPILKAYGVGALSHLTPRILGLAFAQIRRGRGKQEKNGRREIVRILRQTLEIHRFPAFCGFTVALRSVLQPFFERLISSNTALASDPARECVLQSRKIFASFSAGALAAAGGLQLLNSKQKGDAGRTLDLTLFALTRAIDIIVGELWEKRKEQRKRSGKFTAAEASIGYLADSAVFALSSGIIMYAWLYSRERLPSSYSKQITKFAKADERLIEALRRIRSGEYVYGVDTGQAHLLESYCEDIGLPKAWGDPSQSIPIPCEVVHGAYSKNCEIFALSRFWQATWKTALPIYLGLNMLKFLRPRKPDAVALLQALIGAVRSSAFIGSFIGLFWYGVCLTRTRLGPKFLPLSPLALDNLCIKVACVLCGWSILAENRRRRTEIMFFVAPRALATILPRKYDPKYQWIETTTFAAGSGIILSTLKHNPTRVRGVFGKLLGKILTK